MTSSCCPLLETAVAAALAASRVHTDAVCRGGERRVTEKTMASDFVSEVDMAAQHAALEVISDRYPNHRVVAEEDGGSRGSLQAEFTWLVDPLDGTTNFLHGHPFYASSVAVWDAGGPRAAAVHSSPLDKLWTAARGQGAHQNGQRLKVSQAAEMRRFLLGTGFPFKNIGLLEGYLGELNQALRHTAGVRRAGSAALDLAYVARGTLDGFWESRLAPWDYGAGVLLVTEAGGAVERLEGGPITMAAGSVIAANSQRSLDRLRELLARG